jgi:hypothetical protein
MSVDSTKFDPGEMRPGLYLIHATALDAARAAAGHDDLDGPHEPLVDTEGYELEYIDNRRRDPWASVADTPADAWIVVRLYHDGWVVV